MKLQLVALFSFTLLLTGCATTQKEVSQAPVPAKLPQRGDATEKNVAEWAQYYLDTGLATDMGGALKMARDRFWPELKGSGSVLARIEENNEALKKHAEKSKK